MKTFVHYFPVNWFHVWQPLFPSQCEVSRGTIANVMSIETANHDVLFAPNVRIQSSPGKGRKCRSKESPYANEIVCAMWMWLDYELIIISFPFATRHNIKPVIMFSIKILNKAEYSLSVSIVVMVGKWTNFIISSSLSRVERFFAILIKKLSWLQGFTGPLWGLHLKFQNNYMATANL